MSAGPCFVFVLVILIRSLKLVNGAAAPGMSSADVTVIVRVRSSAVIVDLTGQQLSSGPIYNCLDGNWLSLTKPGSSPTRLILQFAEVPKDQLWHLLQIVADQQVRQTANLLDRVSAGDDFDARVKALTQVPEILFGLPTCIMTAERQGHPANTEIGGQLRDL